MSKIHNFKIRVYYEDTDSGGIVYYANYLKFAERARTELLRSLSINQSNLLNRHNISFVVRKANLDLIKPARLDNELSIYSKITKLKNASMLMEQKIIFANKTICNITVLLATVNTNLKPVRIPKPIIEKLKDYA